MPVYAFLLQFKLTVPKMGNISDLLAVLSKETNIPKDKVISICLVSLVQQNNVNLNVILNNHSILTDGFPQSRAVKSQHCMCELEHQ